VTTALAPAPAAPTITPEQLALIKRTIAQDATDTELQLFFYDCARRGVHPLDRLIHFTKRGGKYTPVTSIDYMRSRAAGSGECGGQDDATFAGETKQSDFAATVTVYRLVQGQRCAFTATARWPEYKPTDDFMWRKMPHTMLSKCAEALALRKAFPQELAGLYTAEELARPDVIEGGIDEATGEITETTGPESITKQQRKRLFTIATKKGWSKGLMQEALKTKFGLDSTSAITRAQYDDVVASFEEAPPTDPEAPL
jgi:phage recombination protein Bet